MGYTPNEWKPLDIITSEKLNELENGLTKTSEDVVYGMGGATQSSDGIHSLTYINKGDALPNNPQVGDTVYMKDGNDYSILEWDGEQWNTRIDPKLSERIQTALDTAKADATEQINKNNEQINETINTVAQEKVDLAIKDADFNDKAQAMADKALQDAKDNTATVAQETLDSANDNIAQAKSDITDAYETADGVIDKKIDDTASSITTTINQNKTDADGKISSAQSTATQALNEVSTKVSQTDYDTKTGDLDTRVTKAQTTADGAVTTVGNYQTSNDARVKAAETKISQNANDITLRATTADLNNAKSDYNAQIAQVKIDAGKVETTVSNLSDTVDNISIGNRNYLLNSDVSTTSNITDFKSSKTISSFSGQKIVVSVQVDYDNITSIFNQKRIGAEFTVVNANTNATIYFGTWKNPIVGESFHGRIYQTFDFTSLNIKGYSSDNLTFGQGIYIQGVNGTNVSISRPKIEIGNKATDWSPAPEDTVNALASQQVTIDGITDTVSKQGTNIDSVTKRVTTAEGTLTTATNNITGLQTQQTTTSNQVTQEISDRKTGDNNTLQSSKDFTTSSITSAVNGVNSTITQTASGILAQVEATNMVVNSEFDPLDGTWYQLVGSGAVNSTVGTAWSPTSTLSFSDWAVVDGSTLLTYAVGTWFTTALAPAGAGRAYSASIVAGRPSAVTTSTALDLRIGFWDANKKLLSNASSGNIIDGTTYKGIDKYKVENKVAPANTKYVSVIIAHSSANATDIIGRPMLNNGATVSPYVATFGNTSSSTILSLFKDNWSIGIKDNQGLLTTGLFGDINGMTLNGKTVTIDANTTNITGTTWISSAMIQSAAIQTANIADAAITNAKIATLDVAKITGDVSSFIQSNWNGQFGSTTIDSTGMEVVTGKAKTKFGDGSMSLISTKGENIGWIGRQVDSVYDNLDFLTFGLNGYHTTTPGDEHYDDNGNNTDQFYGGDGIIFGISTTGGGYLPLLQWNSDLAAGYRSGRRGWMFTQPIVAGLTVYTENANNDSNGIIMQPQTIDNVYYPVLTSISSGGSTGYAIGLGASYMYAGNTRILRADSNGYLYYQTTKTGSSGKSLLMASDGAIIAQSSATKYKSNIKYEKDTTFGDKLLTIDPATWSDKNEVEQISEYNRTGKEPDYAMNKDGARYYGLIAEDMVKAGLEELVVRDTVTGAVEGIQYEKIGAALIPLLREQRNQINILKLEVEKLKVKINEQYSNEK